MVASKSIHTRLFACHVVCWFPQGMIIFPGGMGGHRKNPFRGEGGYGYFMELHNMENI